MNENVFTYIIVPCYNEEKRIDKNNFLNFCKVHSNVHFVFVNDCSEDKTIELLNEMQRVNSQQVFVVDLPKNSGKAEAVRQGVRYALDHNCDFFGFWDADLSTPLSDIKIFVDKLNECPDLDIVIGARVKLLGRSIQRFAIRHYLGRIFATCASMILRLPVYDTQCGAKLFRNNKNIAKIFDRPYCTKWIFDVELLARYLTLSNFKHCHEAAQKIYEHPLETWTHVSGSKIKSRDFVTSGFDLFRIWLVYGKKLKNISKIEQVHN